MNSGICLHCSHPNPSGALFCEECGKDLVVKKKPSQHEITMGREADNHLVLDYNMVSSYHAVLRLLPNGMEVEDLGSTNGTFLNNHESRISKAIVGENDTLYLGTFKLPVKRILRCHGVWLPSEQPLIPYPAKQWLVGSAPQAAIRVQHPEIAPNHAEFKITDSRLLVKSLVPDGVFVNGQPAVETTSLNIGDHVFIGPLCLIPEKKGLRKIETWRQHTLEARDIHVVAASGKHGTKTLLENISFTLFPGQLCGLMGVAGAGKTTLIKTINGYQAPSSGKVLINGLNLYERFETFRTALGYVPQEDIFHKDLTVEQALGYAVGLRLGPMSREDRAQLIHHVLDHLAMFDANPQIAESRINQISGGQKRRLNIAIELLSDPAVFFLDEPTSGLSSEDALVVMQVLYNMAAEGKTILLTLHQPSYEIYELMDQVIYLHKGGVMVYGGPAAPDSILYTNPQLQPSEANTPDLVLRSLDKGQPKDLNKNYVNSSYHKEFVRNRRTLNRKTPKPPVQKKKTGVSKFFQWKVLHARNWRARFQDRINALVLMLQSPVIATLIAVVFHGNNREIYESAATIYFLMVIASVWFGCSNSARDICGEWAIYRRERMYNLGVIPYVISKLTVGFLISLIQCVALLAIVTSFCRLNAPLLPVLAALWFASLCGICIGLFVSAFSSPFKKSNEIAVGLIPIILLPMVILGGLIKPIKEMSPATLALASAMPTRWAFEAAMVLEDSRTRGEVTLETPLGDKKERKRDLLTESIFEREKLQSAGYNMIRPLFIGLFFVLLTFGYLRFLDKSRR